MAFTSGSARLNQIYEKLFYIKGRKGELHGNNNYQSWADEA